MIDKIEIDHPTLTHLFGYLDVFQWVNAIKNGEVNVDIVWELLKIQDRAYKGRMFEHVSEVINMSAAEYKEWLHG